MRVAGLCFIYVVMFFVAGCSDRKEQREYISIPGTLIKIIPPEEFTLAPDIGGFKHNRLTASIMVQESPKDFKTVSDSYTDSTLIRQGGELLTSFPIAVDSTEAMMYKTFRVSQGLNFVQWSLVMQMEDHVVTVISSYLKQNDRELSGRVKEALMTTRIDRNADHKKSLLSFIIEGEPLKQAKLLQGPSIMFTGNGEWNDQSIFQLSFFAGPSLENAMVERSPDFVMGQLRNICADCKVEKGGLKEISIDSLDGYEIVSYRIDSATHTQRLKYQVVLFEDTRYYLLAGTASEHHEENLSAFRTIAHTFRRKRSV
ncbi:hypothetical protein ACFQ21_17465 [Ohtaekwangia kribbensis]|jgi:hypothetical protein|uniref:DUF1795 domain-containing protein n=1 Tax=Ohtaekwangia kribbensis TaxID=688913 RepID=A0ABW3K515_9BACT